MSQLGCKDMDLESPDPIFNANLGPDENLIWTKKLRCSHTIRHEYMFILLARSALLKYLPNIAAVVFRINNNYQRPLLAQVHLQQISKVGESRIIWLSIVSSSTLYTFYQIQNLVQSVHF